MSKWDLFDTRVYACICHTRNRLKKDESGHLES